MALFCFLHSVADSNVNKQKTHVARAAFQPPNSLHRITIRTSVLFTIAPNNGIAKCWLATQ